MSASSVVTLPVDAAEDLRDRKAEHIQLALGDQSEDASPSGALRKLAQQPFGRQKLYVPVIGWLESTSMRVPWRRRLAPRTAK